MKKSITKLNDFVYTNIQNVGVILNYKGNFLVEEDDINDFVSYCSSHNFQFSIDILRYGDTKKYYVEIWNGLSGVGNNDVSVNKQYSSAKFEFTNKLKDLLDRKILEKGNATLEKDFKLFNNNVIKQKFNNIYVDDMEKNKDTILKLEKEIFKKHFGEFLEVQGTNNGNFSEGNLKEILQRVGNGSGTGIGTSNLVKTDSFMGDEMYSFVISNEFIMSYFLLWNDRVSKNGRYGEIDILKFLKFVDTELNFDKYFLRFSFNDNVDALGNTYSDGTFKMKGDSTLYTYPDAENLKKMWGFTTSLFLFSDTPDLGVVSKKIMHSFQSVDIVVPDEAYPCSPFYIHDNAFLGSNLIPEGDIKNFFSILKKYEYNANGIVYGREFYSNIILKGYPHAKAGINNLGKLERGAHTVVAGTTGSGKTEYSINIWKQFGNDGTRGFYIDNIGGMNRRVMKNHPGLEFEDFKWGVDFVNFKKNQLSNYFGLDGKINEMVSKKQELEKKVKKEKEDSTGDSTEIENMEKEITDLGNKIRYLSENSTGINQVMFQFVESEYNNGVRNLDLQKFLDIYVEKVHAMELPEKIRSFVLDEIKVNNNLTVREIFKKEYQNINIIGKMGYLAEIGIDEIVDKTELLGILVNINNIEDTQLKDYVKTVIGGYLNKIPYGEFFLWDEFKKYVLDTLEREKVLSSSQESIVRGKLNGVSKQYVNLLNAKVDVIDYLRKQKLCILDISSLSSESETNKNLLYIFFTILNFFMRYDSERNAGNPVITYLFIEEFHNYLTEIDTPSKRLKRIVSKMIKETRNYSTIIYLISQLYKDFEESGVLGNIAQYILFDKNNVQSFQKENANSVVYKQYMENFVALYDTEGFSDEREDGEFKTKSNYRLGFIFNKINRDECFIAKVKLSDFR